MQLLLDLLFKNAIEWHGWGRGGLIIFTSTLPCAPPNPIQNEYLFVCGALVYKVFMSLILFLSLELLHCIYKMFAKPLFVYH